MRSSSARRVLLFAPIEFLREIVTGVAVRVPVVKFGGDRVAQFLIEAGGLVVHRVEVNMPAAAPIASCSANSISRRPTP